MYKPSFFAKFKLNNFIEWRLQYEQPTMQVTSLISQTSHLPTFIVPPRIACVDEKGNPISSDPFEKPDDCTNFYQVLQL